MKESRFIEKNKKDWEQLELLLERSHRDADKISALFTKVSSDLSYARTFFPNRSVRVYLNELTRKVFDTIKRKQKNNFRERIHRFFTQILPFEIIQSRKCFFYSFLIFSVSILIGVVSGKYNPDFVNVVLGDEYVSMTEQNIAIGDPMAVYKDPDQISMMYGITVNNIMVSFFAFVLGFFGGLGTVIILMYNGIMLGAFQFFFYQKGLFMTSFLTIWIHGTIEISAIIIAGAAGLLLGQGILFPKSYNRMISLQVHARRALRILIGTIPLFVIAGLLESFVTRLTDLPDAVKAIIIICSLLFILLMWVIYPWLYSQNKDIDNNDFEVKPYKDEVINFDIAGHHSFRKILSLSFAEYRTQLSVIIKKIWIPCVLISALIVLFSLSYINGAYPNIVERISLLDSSYIGLPLMLSYAFLISLCFLSVSYYLNQTHRNLTFLQFVKLNGFPCVLISLFITACIFYISNNSWIVFMILFPIQVPYILLAMIDKKESIKLIDIAKAVNFSYRNYFLFLAPMLIAFLIFLLLNLFLQTNVVVLFTDFLSWHSPFKLYLVNKAMVYYLIFFSGLFMIIPFYYILFRRMFLSTEALHTGSDLRNKFDVFDQKISIFE